MFGEPGCTECNGIDLWDSRVQGDLLDALSTTAGALASAFHLDNCADDGVIAVVQLRSSQEPTELVPYDPTLPFCTGIHRVCDTCGAARMLSNPAARNRSYLLRDTHTCETLV